MGSFEREAARLIKEWNAKVKQKKDKNLKDITFDYTPINPESKNEFNTMYKLLEQAELHYKNNEVEVSKELLKTLSNYIEKKILKDNGL